jgi:hypothetical protein
MTQDQKIIRNKLGLLKLAQTLGSVSMRARCSASAATASTASRSSTRPVARRPWPRSRARSPNFKNRADPKIEQAVVEFAIEQPAYGQVRVANEIKKRGLSVTRRAFAPSGCATTCRPSSSG